MMETKEIMVSIVMPNFNKGKFIEESINSVLGQSYPNIELIIIDDNSTDNSDEVIKNMVSRSSQIKYYRQSENKGGSFARNIGIKNATGEYIMFLDSDDLITLDCIKNRVKYSSENNDDDFIVFTIGTFIDKIGDYNSIWNDYHGDHLKRFLSHDLPWHTSSCFWKSNTLKELNGFNDSFVRLQDVELHTRALLMDNVSYHCVDNVEPDCYYRISNDRIETNLFDFYQRRINGVLKYIDFFKNYLIQKDRKGMAKYLRLTYFEMLAQVLNISSKIKKQEFDLLLESLLQKMPTDIFNGISGFLVNSYTKLRRKGIYVRGMNKLFRKLLA